MCKANKSGACPGRVPGMMSLPDVRCVKDQVGDLVSEGVMVNDTASAEAYLGDVSFCRLRGYLPGLNGVDGKLRADATFEMLTGLYEFDSGFRRLVFGEMEMIEVSFRTRLVNYFSNEYTDTAAYLDYRNFYRGEDKESRNDGCAGSSGCTLAGNAASPDLTKSESLAVSLVEEMILQINRKIDVPIRHRDDHDYSGVNIPFCEAAEYMSLSTMTKFFKDMKKGDRERFRDVNYGKIGCQTLDTWLRSISYVRNICAHHDRLYNIEMRFKPRLDGGIRSYSDGGVGDDRIFGVLLCMRRFIDDAEWGRFVSALKELIRGHDELNVSLMGFPVKWEKELLNRIVN